jgi:hypothetical protein
MIKRAAVRVDLGRRFNSAKKEKTHRIRANMQTLQREILGCELAGSQPPLLRDANDKRQSIAMIIPSDLPTTEGWKINSGHYEGTLLVLPASIGIISL